MEDRQRPGDASPDPMPDIKAFWKRYAEAFAAPLHANQLLGAFTSNPNLTGAYAEAWVRTLVRTMVQSLCVSTGGILRTTDASSSKPVARRIPQTDLIFWDPTELPALFQTGEFALVHTQAARAIIEVKRSAAKIADLQDQLKEQRRRLLSEYRRNTLAVVISHRASPFIGDVTPNWVTNVNLAEPPPVIRLLDSKSQPDTDGVFALIYFLSHVARIPQRGPLPRTI